MVPLEKDQCYGGNGFLVVIQTVEKTVELRGRDAHVASL